MRQDAFSAFPMLAGLDADSAGLLERTARRLTVPAGTVLFRDGSDCTSYVLVIRGSVRVQKLAENGREIVLYRVERGQSCVLTTNCLIAHETYGAEGIAETEVELLTVPAATFRALLAGSETFRHFVFSAYATRLADLLTLIEEVAFGRIDARLATWLLGRADGDGGIRATHHDIATELGTAREVVSRQLKEFERRGWVGLYRGRVLVRDGKALAALAQGV